MPKPCYVLGGLSALNKLKNEMNILEAIGAFAILIVAIVSLYKLYRKIFGYSWNSCPNDHDTMARYGASKCDKCSSEL